MPHPHVSRMVALVVLVVVAGGSWTASGDAQMATLACLTGQRR